MNLTKKIAQGILAKYKLGQLFNISKEALGVTGGAFCLNDTYIVKFEGRYLPDDRRIERNAAMCEILARHRIPAPKLVALDTSKTIVSLKYVIMTKLEGDELSSVWKKLPPREQQAVAIEYGTLMASLHQIPMKKCGDILDNDQQSDSWYAYITARHKKHLDYLENNSIIPAEALARARQVLAENDALFNVTIKPVLLHVDFQAKNIKYNRGKIIGIFDFDECLGGHHEFEFTKVFIPYKIDSAYKDAIVKGYETIGTLSSSFDRRVRLYSLGFILTFFWFAHVNKILTPALKDKYLLSLKQLFNELAVNN